MSTTTPPSTTREIKVWGGRVTMTVNVFGQGPPLLYLHPAGGFLADSFLGRLGSDYTIYAPELPGTTRGASGDIHEVDDVSDLVLIYEEAIRQLELGSGLRMIGQSMGGMLALELAAQFPTLFTQVVALDPVGLWLDEAPYVNILAMPPEQLPGMLFHDADGPAARAMFTLPDDPKVAVDLQAQLVWALGCAGKFLWPMPDHGLRKRLHRIDAETLIVWGEEDRLVPVAHAHEFGKLIPTSRVETIASCGHIPQMEAEDQTLDLVRDFLGH